MYKVVVADDEKIIREGLEMLVEWKQFDFEVVATFEDGNSLIEYIKFNPVDVVVTDIKMPNGTGLDVAKYCYDKKIKCQVVLISAYQEFEFAKSAMKYGVRDYLLKPVDMEVIEELLEKLKIELDEEKYKDALYFESENEFLSKLVLGIWSNRDYVRDKVRGFYPDINPDECVCALVNLTLPDYESMMNGSWHYARQQFDDAMKSFCGVVSKDSIFRVVFKEKGDIRLFVLMKKATGSKETERELCMKQMELFRQSFKEIFQTDINVTIESVYSNVFQMVEAQKEIVQKKGLLRRRNLSEKKKLIVSNLLENNNWTAYRIFESVMNNELLKEDFLAKKEFVNDLFLRLIHLWEESDVKRMQEIGAGISYRTLSGITTEKDLYRYCERAFGTVSFKTDNGIQVKDGVVEKVLSYIDQHIMEDIVMEDVANQMYISVPYLAKHFKKKTGETFLQCVTRKKMEKAAEMIRDTDYMIYEIGEKLGYHTPRYFSKLFYEYMKCYPSEYRKTLLKDGRENAEIY